MEKKVLGVFIFSLFTIFLFSSFVSAASWSEFKTSISGPATDISSMFASDTWLKIIFSFIVFLVISALTTRIPIFEEKKGIAVWFSIAVTILAVWFIPKDLVRQIINPYTALGVAILSIIPFLLMFLFTRYMITNTFLKQAAWMFFAVTLIGLSIAAAIKTPNNPYIYVYGAASIAALGLLFFGQKLEHAMWEGEQEAKYTAAEKQMRERLALDRLKTEEAGIVLGGGDSI